MSSFASSFATYFTEAEETRLFATVKSVNALNAKRDYYLMLLVRETGIRLAILVGADPVKHKIHNLPPKGLTLGDAEQSISEKYLVYQASNNKRSRHYPIHLSKSAINALEQLIKVHYKMTVDWEWHMPVPERPLLVGRIRGKGLSRRAVQTNIKKWCKLANVPAGTIHWLRHTWAKRYLARSTNKDAALLRIQAVLGHLNLNTTAIYTKPDKEELERAMRQASSCRK